VRLARDPFEVEAAQRLRHSVFVEELGGQGGALTAGGREGDRFDPFCEHLLLLDAKGRVAGTTRLLDEERAARAGGFAAEEEFDLSPLRGSGLPLLEVGRTCLRADYRGLDGLHRLWSALAALVEARRIGVLFGLVSLPGTDAGPWAGALAALDRDRLAPPGLRPRSLGPVAVPAPTCPSPDLPALAKAYLRMGGRVGKGAFRDEAFGCLDLCMVVETARIPDRVRAIYGAGR
jgi:putative hemolysin